MGEREAGSLALTGRTRSSALGKKTSAALRPKGRGRQRRAGTPPANREGQEASEAAGEGQRLKVTARPDDAVPASRAAPGRGAWAQIAARRRGAADPCQQGCGALIRAARRLLGHP